MEENKNTLNEQKEPNSWKQTTCLELEHLQGFYIP